MIICNDCNWKKNFEEWKFHGFPNSWRTTWFSLVDGKANAGSGLGYVFPNDDRIGLLIPPTDGPYVKYYTNYDADLQEAQLFIDTWFPGLVLNEY